MATYTLLGAGELPLARIAAPLPQRRPSSSQNANSDYRLRLSRIYTVLSGVFGAIRVYFATRGGRNASHAHLLAALHMQYTMLSLVAAAKCQAALARYFEGNQI
jgi:hypothetical protein